MDSWPYDDRNARQEPSNKPKGAQPSRDHPYLHQGMVGAVTLAEEKGRFEWSFLQTQESTKPWRMTKPFKVFPETRGPLPRRSPFGAKLSAQHGANFIRTCMPEADIPMELIREQLEEEDVHLSQAEDFDPYVGNTLVSSLRQDTSSSGTGFIAFPMGDIMSDLNISTMNISKQSGVTIKPVASYKRVFGTPILQLVAGSLDHDHLLAIRTFSGTDFLRLKKPPGRATWESESGPRLGIGDTSNREMVDLKLRFDCVLGVTNSGSLHTTRPFSHKPNVAHICDIPDASEFKDPNFWRLAWDLNPNSGFLVSSDSVSTFDLRSSTAPKKYFELNTTTEFLTSVEDCGIDSILRLCSTNQIFWLDRRNMRSPLLSVRHYRHFDRSLSTTTFGKARTLLTSRRNNLISVFDVSQSDDQLLHIRGEPSGVLPLFTMLESVGQTFIRSPFVAEDAHAIVLKLSDRGAISGCSLSSEESEGSLAVDIKNTHALKSIEEQPWEPKEGLMLEQDRTQLSMTGAYEKLFQKYSEGIEQWEEEEAPHVYDLVDQIPDYFRKSDIVSEQMLTTYDVAFRAGDEPKDPSRSDFLTGSILNSQRGYRSLRQGRLNPISLKTRALWHMDLGPTLKRFGVSDAEGEEESFARFNLRDSDTRTGSSLRLEKRSREQLEVDLRLCRNVFSTYPFVKPGEVDQTLETMTEALSLGDTPSEVEFGFLRPVIPTPDAMEGKEEGERQGLGLGVKLLLKDWEVGTDLADCKYQDPYNTAEARPPPRRPAPPPTVRSAPPQVLTQTQPSQPRPTMLMAPPLLTTKKSPSGTPPVLGTQPQAESQKTAPPAQFERFSESQTQTQGGLMASTQVLPGPFGGRPTKKKVEKKRRVGGF